MHHKETRVQLTLPLPTITALSDLQTRYPLLQALPKSKLIHILLSLTLDSNPSPQTIFTNHFTTGPSSLIEKTLKNITQTPPSSIDPNSNS